MVDRPHHQEIPSETAELTGAPIGRQTFVEPQAGPSQPQVRSQPKSMKALGKMRATETDPLNSFTNLIFPISSIRDLQLEERPVCGSARKQNRETKAKVPAPTLKCQQYMPYTPVEPRHAQDSISLVECTSTSMSVPLERISSPSSLTNALRVGTSVTSKPASPSCTRASPSTSSSTSCLSTSRPPSSTSTSTTAQTIPPSTTSNSPASISKKAATPSSDRLVSGDADRVVVDPTPRRTWSPPHPLCNGGGEFLKSDGTIGFTPPITMDQEREFEQAREQAKRGARWFAWELEG